MKEQRQDRGTGTPPVDRPTVAPPRLAPRAASEPPAGTAPVPPATPPRAVTHSPRAATPPAAIGQPVTISDTAHAHGLGTAGLEPVVQILDVGALADGLTPETAEAYIKAEIEKAIRFELEQVGNLIEAARQERLVWVGFTTRRRRKSYRVVLPVQMVAQNVADALGESWAGLREKVRQDGLTRRDYAQANAHLEAAIERLHQARQHLSDPELAFAVGAIGAEIVYL